MKQRPLIIVLFTIFIDLIGFGILIPIIPQLLANPSSPFYLLPKGYTLQQGYIVLGFLIGIFPFMQFLATPILGQLSDRYGRRKILAISLAGTALSYVVFAYGIITRNIPLLFIARAFDGITGGNLAVAQAAVADITAPKDRAKNFGLIGAAFGLGFIAGPYIGGKLADPTLVSWFNAATPFWFAAILAGLNTVSVLLYFPETLKVIRTETIRWSQSLFNILKAFKIKGMRTLFLTSFLFQAGFTLYTTFFSIFLIRKFGYTQGNIGDFFAYIGIWVALTQAVVTRSMTKLFSEVTILRISLFGMAIFILDYFVPTTSLGLHFVTPFMAMFTGLSMATSVALISRSADSSIQGEVLGINASVQALAQAIPPVLSGYIAASLDPNAPIVISAIVICIAGIVFNIFYKRKIPLAGERAQSFHA
jgi:DHA1 family tetracycline resistance protein-like MFS transporter